MATITYEKFTIFGHGYDATRNDSGSGRIEPEYHNLGGASLATIDQTGEYVWITDEGNYLYKFKIKGWETQSHSLPVGSIYHPCNVENNYGVLCVNNNRIIVFDLTSGEIVKDISGTYTKPSNIADCILVDDDIYIVKVFPQNATQTIIKISLTNETVSTSSTGDECICGFVDNDTIYGFWQKVWFTQNSTARGMGFGGATQWQVSESVPDVEFSVRLFGLCGNGYIYVPTPKDGVWTLGKYDGNSAVDFVTPNPIRTIGEFESSFELQWQYSTLNLCYNQGRTKACFATTIGTFYTDFDQVEKMADDSANMRPLAMTDKVIVSKVGNNQVSVTYI
jgi:hypothetical protein